MKNIITEIKKKSICGLSTGMHRAEQKLIIWKIRGINVPSTQHTRIT